MPFGNEIYLSKFLGSWPFRIYVVMGSTSKILGVFAFLFMHLQEGDALRRCPLEIKYIHQVT